MRTGNAPRQGGNIGKFVGSKLEKRKNIQNDGISEWHSGAGGNAIDRALIPGFRVHGQEEEEKHAALSYMVELRKKKDYGDSGG